MQVSILTAFHGPTDHVSQSTNFIDFDRIRLQKAQDIGFTHSDADVFEYAGRGLFFNAQHR